MRRCGDVGGDIVADDDVYSNDDDELAYDDEDEEEDDDDEYGMRRIKPRPHCSCLRVAPLPRSLTSSTVPGPKWGLERAIKSCKARFVLGSIRGWVVYRSG